MLYAEGLDITDGRNAARSNLGSVKLEIVVNDSQ